MRVIELINIMHIELDILSLTEINMQLNKDRQTKEHQIRLEQQNDAKAIKNEELSREVTDLRHHLDSQ